MCKKDDHVLEAAVEALYLLKEVYASGLDSYALERMVEGWIKTYRADIEAAQEKDNE